MIQTIVVLLTLLGQPQSAFIMPQPNDPGAFFGATVGEPGRDGKSICSTRWCWIIDGREICGEKVTIQLKCPETESR